MPPPYPSPASGGGDRTECAAHDLAAISLRYFNVAGAHGSHGERHDPETHLIPNLLKVATGEVESAKIFGSDYPTRDGTAVRDYLHVVDLADAHVRALDAMESGVHKIYNLGSGTGYTVREVLEAVRTATGHPIPAVDADRTQHAGTLRIGNAKFDRWAMSPGAAAPEQILATINHVSRWRATA